MQDDRRFYVYVHRRRSDGSIFYVGKGCGNRHLVSFGRNGWWKSVASRHGWYSEKVSNGLSNKEAMDAEKELISKTDNLVNLTSGGEGWEVYPSAREKMRQAKLGKSQSPEHAQKSRTNKIGKKQPASAVEGLRLRKSKPVINSNGEIFPSASQAARTFSERLGRYVSQGNISLAAKGVRANAYGVSWSMDVSNTPIFTPTSYQERRVLCVDRGEEFLSAQLATAWVKEWRGTASHQCITQAARTGSVAYGYHWRYILDRS